MKWKITACFSVLFILVSRVFSSTSIISPQPYSVVRSNWVKIQILDFEDGVTPDSVVYKIIYANPLSKKDFFWGEKFVNVQKPYEYLLDCKNLRDMLLFISAFVYQHGKIDTLGLENDLRGIPVIVDRKLEYSSLTSFSKFFSKKMSLHSFLNERPSLAFSGQNNEVMFNSCWDNDSFYLRIEVTDKHLNYVEFIKMNYGMEEDYFNALWTSDGLEICFDLNNNKTEWRDLDDKEFIFNISGNFQGNHWNLRKNELLHWGENARVELEINGSVNNNSDIDSGYKLMLAIPWTDFGWAPHGSDTIGFDIQLFDLDIKEGKVFRSFWSLSDLGNNDNTSEWANLYFELDSKSNSQTFLIIALLIITGGILIILKKKYYKKQNDNKPEHHLVKKIKLAGHYRVNGLYKRK